MISLRMVDGITWTVYEDNIEKFTRVFVQALEDNIPIPVERPDDNKLRYINPHQVLYYELKDI